MAQDAVCLKACGIEVRVYPDETGMPAWTSVGAAQPRVADAELAETRVRLAVSDSPPLTDLDIGEFGAYRFDASRSAAWVLRPARSAQWQHEALWGPVLLHALAHRGVHVLHASAAMTPAGQLVVFVADSGVGKSTLARISAALGWRRVSDDLLPIACHQGAFVALPHLHQPKLSEQDQYPANAPAAVPLRMLIHLRRGEECALQPATPREALDLLLANTVATRSYSAQSLAAHLGFAQAMATAAGGPDLRICRGWIASRPSDVEGAVREFLDLVAGTI